MALPALLLACHPVDTERLRVRGDGILLEVVARSDRDQVHLRHFEISVDPPARVGFDCEGAELDRHQRELAAGRAEVQLYGLLADTEYRCTFTARTGDRRVSGELGFRTDPEAGGVPEIRVERTGEPWGAYTLFNTWLTGDGGQDHALLIVDDRGRIRWRHDFGDDTSVGLEARWLEGRSLLIGGGRIAPQRLTLGEEVLWKLPALAGEDRFWHHEAGLTPSGTVLGLHAQPNSTGQRTFEGFEIVEWDPATGEEVWRWSSQEALDAGWLPAGIGRDPWHANAVSWVSDPLGEGVILSLPHLDRILRIDPATDAILWSLGSGQDFALADGSWFSGQHDPEWQDGRLLLHDNGVVRGASRVLELELDPLQRRASVAWEWTEPGWFEPLWGDADRLPSGQVLVTRGHCGFCPDSGVGGSSIAVVDPAGNAVWRLSLPDPEWGLYRAERIDGCDLFDNAALCGVVP